jgi:hypothetical protein
MKPWVVENMEIVEKHLQKRYYGLYYFGLQKVASQINDGFSCFVWISTYFMVNWNGADVMIPITVPLIGGTITSTIYVLLVTPVVFEMTKLRELRTKGKIDIIDAKH